MQTANEIRATFLDYFAQHGHAIVPSSPLVPRNDPTLMFTNAGMVQFKNVFTGLEKRDYARAVTAQKCVRAGGKHNDLENVGYTARHHTFFEMLGNFSFGDYFKDVAIELAWNLITKIYGLPKDRLLVTVFSEDDEAFGLWKKIAGLPQSKIIRVPTSDNFWAMGDTGPCGPCSEIFFDHGPTIAGGPPGGADAEGDRFIEIWNLVFMQYEQVTKESRVALPKPSIDTGMGLERLAAVLQGKHDNYDIDLMRALILASAEASGTEADGPHAVSHRVIADHLRATSFLIADGVSPSNEGRGYVLRRIMRRAMRHAHKLGAKDPLVWKLVPALVAQMGQAYPDLIRAQAMIAETLRHEEAQFKRTLERGLKLLDEETGRLAGQAALSGEVAFKLYDTYGFPLDLTQDIMRGQGRKVDNAGFDAAMERQRAAARKAWAGSGEAATDAQWFDLRDKLGATEFLGYSTEMAEGKVLALLIAGQQADTAEAGAEIALIANQTPFYGESGGQMGDSGIMFSAAGAEIAITDTQKKLGDLHVHHGKVTKGRIAVGDALEMRVDAERRTALRANHSATHLLHEALRRRLGNHVTQKGSLVAPDRLRFDFSHPKPIGADDLRAIEAEVNHRVRLNAAVTTRFMTPDEAVKEGALALFGEKYGDEVRVVSMGGDDETRHFSTELCGGTHVRRAGDIGLFKITGEGAVAAGVRRIDALTGKGAVDYVAERDRLLSDAAEVIKVQPAELAARIVALLEDRKRLERQVSDMRRDKLLLRAASGDHRVEGSSADLRYDKIKQALTEPSKPTAIGSTRESGTFQIIRDQTNGNEFKWFEQSFSDVPAKDLRGLADEFKKQIGSGIVGFVATDENKAAVLVAVTDDLKDRYDARELVKSGVATLGGQGGGGRPDMAQGGGPAVDKAQDALNAIEQAVRKRASA